MKKIWSCSLFTIRKRYQKQHPPRHHLSWTNLVCYDLHSRQLGNLSGRHLNNFEGTCTAGQCPSTGRMYVLVVLAYFSHSDKYCGIADIAATKHNNYGQWCISGGAWSPEGIQLIISNPSFLPKYKRAVKWQTCSTLLLKPVLEQPIPDVSF